MAERVDLFLIDKPEDSFEIDDARVCAYTHNPCVVPNTRACCGMIVEHPAPWNRPKGEVDPAGFVLDQTVVVDGELVDA